MNNYSKQNHEQEFSMNQKVAAETINTTIKELDDTQLESVCGGNRPVWCPQTKKYVWVRTRGGVYSEGPMPPSSDGM
ncbi:MAG: hypothetical protein KME64_30890 [Scytonematopsis contorta HA4267-MV1]|jgi:FMN-dependent NADH-azoreductase|nr:hypothetical protein [Scytonematopsis contorta HA4267-MV1]